jgi:hypothetical protein
VRVEKGEEEEEGEEKQVKCITRRMVFQMFI